MTFQDRSRPTSSPWRACPPIKSAADSSPVNDHPPTSAALTRGRCRVHVSLSPIFTGRGPESGAAIHTAELSKPVALGQSRRFGINRAEV